jgi:hypothetical protein
MQITQNSSAFLIVTILWLCSIFCNAFLQSSRKHRAEKVSYRLPAVWYVGFNHIVADVYWFKCIANNQFSSAEELFFYADFITDLDPHFNIVYRYAAILLAHRFNHKNLAAQLLEKGIRSSFNQNDWRLHAHLAHLSKTNDHKKMKGMCFAEKKRPFLASHWPEMPNFLKSWQINS